MIVMEIVTVTITEAIIEITVTDVVGNIVMETGMIIAVTGHVATDYPLVIAAIM
jgi:hypothetical protein